jgi:1L-myo-inositol 1-phosphate cytidylyltransferase
VDNSNTGRKGVVLAAGLGSRLQDGGAKPVLKPLTRVDGVPLFERTVRSLALAGCDGAVVVLGFEAMAVRAAIEAELRPPIPIQFVVNDRYDLANGVSVLSAREHVGEEFVLTMADHVFGPDVLRIAAGHHPPSAGATLLVDYKLDCIFDMDDATKVLERDGRIVSIGKQIADFNCVDTGLFVCTTALMDALSETFRDSGDASLSDGVGRLAASGRMHVADIGNGFWQDIDTPEMLQHAEQELASMRLSSGADGGTSTRR